MIIHGELKEQIPVKMSAVSVEEAIAAVAGLPNGPEILDELQSSDLAHSYYHYFPARYSYDTIKTVLFYLESGKLATAMRKRGYLVTTNKRDYLRRRVPKTEEKLIRNTPLMDAILKEITDIKWKVEETNSLEQKGILDVKEGEALIFCPILNTREQFLEDNMLDESRVVR